MGSMKHPRGWLAGSAVAITITATAIAASALGTASATTSQFHRASHVRPNATHAVSNTTATAYPVQAITQEFGSNTQPFCPANSGNLPCDGAATNAYGTIDRVPSGFSNDGVGNYAPFTKALTGGWMALVTGTTVRNQGGGCPSTVVEACTGPYALFGTGKAMGAENVFPANGFTVTSDLYLSPTTAAPAGSLVDDDVELNNSAGGYGIDNIITACAETTTKGFGFAINFGHNSPGSCADTSTTPVVTKDGWYRFVFYFTDIKGNAYVNEEVLSESTGTAVGWSGRQAVGGGVPEPASKWGGPGYFWLPTEQFAGLPLANFALQLGYVAGGHKP